MIHKPYHIITAAIAATALLAGCGSATVPGDYTVSEQQAVISPDYTDLTIPCNIAPLNFRVEEEGDEYITHLHSSADPDGIAVPGRDLNIPLDDWHRLLSATRGDTLTVDIYVRRDGAWQRYPAIRHAVADSIDSYISYRLIEPSYIGYETMALCQRNLTNFEEHEIFNSQALSTKTEGQCINCHSYQDYNREGNMQFHARQNKGGTVIIRGDSIKKINLKADSLISSGVYPSWHPTEPLIAYSVNSTTQSFHTRHPNKVEVQDSASDIILYDVENDSSIIVANGRTELETFPYWHPDGKSLWFVSATIPELTEDEMKTYENSHYRDFKYNLYRRSFDPATRTFGETDTIFLASNHGMSVTLPRPSPDGRYVLVSVGEFGNFHIWHKDSDLYLVDMETKTVRPLSEVNSPNVESYHSWSSNGRWILFSTRRDDGSYTRLYIAYFGPDGKAGKPFRVPQSTPGFDLERMKSYNVPEFMVCPVKVSKKQIVDALESDAVNVALRN